MYEPFNSLVLVSSSTVNGCVHFLENYLREFDITLLFIKTVYFSIDVSGLTRIDTPRNAAERRVFFKSSKILAVVAFGESGLLSCSGKFAVFFLCSTLHSSPLFFHFHDRSFGNSERIDFVSYYLTYSTLVFVRKCRRNFTLDYFDIIFPPLRK